jgi:hypothetical protein
LKPHRDFLEAIVITLLAFAFGFVAGLSWCGR